VSRKGLGTGEMRRYYRREWRQLPCMCPGHREMRARNRAGVEVTAADCRALAEAHMAADRARERRLAWFRKRARHRRWRSRR